MAILSSTSVINITKTRLLVAVSLAFTYVHGCLFMPLL